MNIQELKNSQCLIFECIGGSKAYGLETEHSDVDLRGVFVLPRHQFYSFHYQDQISDEQNNHIYYELRKFLDLLAKNNPSMLELLNIPPDCILYQHPLFNKIQAHCFLSKQCKETFAHYAMSQLKKARGLNKKIMNPMDEKRKSPLDFCYILDQERVISLENFFKAKAIQEKYCGLVTIPHMRDMYQMYYSEKNIYNGIIQDDQAMDVKLSSVPKGEKPIAILSFNKEGYSRYCKDYKDYREWIAKRNQHRYQNTIEHGKNYDAKNMMHVFRLFQMAEDIGRLEKVIVRQEQRDFLLSIKQGEFSYEELVEKAHQKLEEIENIYKISQLPDKPDLKSINQLLVEIRQEFYQEI